ncbi:MAG: hypothetical protein IJ033_00510, partial [Clostridia bacterium]|nr:hypothetical protein [Clostridia bacterium]
FDNTNLSSEDIAELNQYKKERKNSVNRFAEKAKELFDFNEEGLAKVSTAVADAVGKIDRAGSYKTIDTAVDVAKNSIIEADVTLGCNARRLFWENDNSILVKQEFFEGNRTYGCFYTNPETSKIEIDNSSPKCVAYIYKDQEAFNAILNEPITVDFENKIVVVIIDTKYANVSYWYVKYAVIGDSLKVNMIQKRDSSSNKDGYNDATAPYPYQVVTAMEIDRANVKSVDFTTLSISEIY